MQRTATAMLALFLLTGCTTPAFVSPVAVTRFSAAAPATMLRAGGTITIAPAPGSDSDVQDYAAFAAAVATELEQLGFTVLPAGGNRTALLSLARQVRPPERRGPVSVGGGASIGSHGSGMGLGIGIDLTPRPGEAVETRLALAIRDAAGGGNLWEGRASMTASANSDAAEAQPAAARMAAALLQGFPGNSGETISVP